MRAIECAVNRPFVRISMAAFTSLFSHTNHDLVAGKARRFTKFLHAAVAGTMFDRPRVQPRWTAELKWEPPMPNVTQNSYDDVEAELNTMRAANLAKFVLFVGGDGLSIVRIWWLLQKYPELYVDSAPLIVPVQGESPHGVFHIMHAGWRLYWRFIEWCSDVLNRKEGTIKEDPKVSDFNSHYYFLQIITRACAEVIGELQATGAGVDHPEALMAEAERNVACAWVCHFLHDFAFMVFEFKQGVRASDAATLDRLWREFFASGHSSTANKKLYVPMAIMRVWQSLALSPPLTRLMNCTLSIPLSPKQGAMVGWDLPCEHLNAYITATVQGQVSPEAIDRAVARYPLFQHNRAMLQPNSSEHMMKDMEADVQLLKAALSKRDVLGTTWQSATKRSADAPWTQNRNQRGRAPWVEVDATMAATGRGAIGPFIAATVRRYTDTYYAFLP